MEPFRIVALVYTAVWFGHLPFTRLRLFNRLGDYSYGIFVFHWPVAQVVLHYNPAITYGELLVNVVPIALALAVISWHGLEAPLLRSRASIAAGLVTTGRVLRGIWRDAIEVMTVYPDEEEPKPGPQRAPAPCPQPYAKRVMMPVSATAALPVPGNGGVRSSERVKPPHQSFAAPQPVLYAPGAARQPDAPPYCEPTRRQPKGYWQ